MTQRQLARIDHAIVTGIHPSTYLTHRHLTGKPHNVVAEYATNCARDIVLDRFGRSGVTVMEALKLGRRAVDCDMNPMPIHVVIAERAGIRV
jgi:hypothetical protein